MKKRFLLFFLCGFVSISSFTQENPQKMKWVWKTSVGYALPVSEFPSGHITDHFIGNNHDRLFGQIASFIYFFNEHWGLENSIIHYNIENNRIDEQTDLFRSKIAGRYPDYYVNGNFYSIQSQMLAWKFGPVYKWEQERFIYSIGLPVLGFVDMTTPDITLRLKRKNSHEIKKLNYSTSSEDYSGTIDFYSFSPYFSAGYRLSKRIILNFDVGINAYKAKFNYKEIEYNLLTNSTISKTYPYNKWVADINFGIGFWVVIGRRR